MRSYTPTSSDDDLGYFDLLIKVIFSFHSVARVLMLPSLTRKAISPAMYPSSKLATIFASKVQKASSTTPQHCLVKLA